MSKITSAILRKAAMIHKATGGQCVAGVVFAGDNTMFVLEGNRADLPGDVEYFDKCPVCGKELRK